MEKKREESKGDNADEVKRWRVIVEGKGLLRSREGDVSTGGKKVKVISIVWCSWSSKEERTARQERSTGRKDGFPDFMWQRVLGGGGCRQEEEYGSMQGILGEGIVSCGARERYSWL